MSSSIHSSTILKDCSNFLAPSNSSKSPNKRPLLLPTSYVYGKISPTTMPSKELNELRDTRLILQIKKTNRSNVGNTAKKAKILSDNSSNQVLREVNLTLTEGEYHGYALNNIPEGNGVYIKSGSQYEGYWKNGKRHGYGIWINNKDKYEGNWKNGLREGQGLQVLSNGDVYAGDWKAGKPDGKGTQTLACGEEYTGEWKEGKHHGEGTYIFANGDVFEGYWENGLRDGEGIYTKKNGAAYRGNWEAGKRVGELNKIINDIQSEKENQEPKTVNGKTDSDDIQVSTQILKGHNK